MGNDSVEKSLGERIDKGRKAIAKAQGRDTKEWEKHLANLESQMEKKSDGNVMVKMGKFGFCTCLLGPPLCSGCWKINESCDCVIMQVNPKDVINEQYAQYIKNTLVH